MLKAAFLHDMIILFFLFFFLGGGGYVLPNDDSVRILYISKLQMIHIEKNIVIQHSVTSGHQQTSNW